MPNSETLQLVLYVVGGIVLLAVVIVVFNFFGAWLRAYVANARVDIMELIALRLRRVPVGMVVDSRITAVKAGIPVTADQLSTHYLAGGNITMVVSALIASQKANLNLTFDHACAIDLATKGTTKTVLEAVQTSVNPKVIDCPKGEQGGRKTIDAVAKDGIALKARARVTVRTDLDGFVGGATEETIIARVGEGIVTTIGSSGTYKDVLENPDRISKTVLSKGLDSGTAFEILSIDIADVDVGSNIGAHLQTDQAEADTKRYQAEAEKRRALAVAQEAEYEAEASKNRALVILAEAEVPKAMAEAFRSGNMGIMDYYRMQNVIADTSMRSSVGTDKKSQGS